jgi:sphinganine-1-phosphate aldolase
MFLTDQIRIVSSTAHAAFLKGAHYFDIEFVTVPVNEKTFEADVDGIRRAINRNTIMVIASAPTFPHGVVDPVDQISTMLEKFPNVWLHVDCCLGGFILPWLEKIGQFNKRFDFRVPRVMSISADLHKYGYGPKGLFLFVCLFVSVEEVG